MPPWKADPGYGEWSNDARLSDSEIAVLKAWTSGPKPAGDPKDMPPVPEFHDGWKIGKPDVIFSIPEHKLDATGPDEYDYIKVPTNFKEDRWVVAAELKPGNRKIVHHAHVFVEEPAGSKDAANKDAAARYDDWLIVHEGTLEYMRPDAPVINDGCARDDNGLLPGAKIANLGNLVCSYLPGRDAEVFPPGAARKNSAALPSLLTRTSHCASAWPIVGVCTVAHSAWMSPARSSSPRMPMMPPARCTSSM